ncbi:hypothetical protein JNK62_01195 [bacterium]|nr:hypothetical protein [bacterium]
MADTVITPSAYERNDSSAAGWAVAVIVLLGVVLFGLFVWPGMTRTSTGNASTPGAIDVNVQLPEGVQQGIQGAGAGAGAQQGTQPSGGTTNTPTPTQ